MPAIVHGFPQWTAVLLVLLVAQTCLIIFLLLRSRPLFFRGRERRRSDRLHSARLVLTAEIATSVAHEVLQPLSAILNNADAVEALMRGGPVRGVQLPSIVMDMREDAMRTACIVRTVRALLSESDLQTSPVNVNRITRESLQLLKLYAAQRRVIVRMTLDPALPCALGDRIHLQRLLLGILVSSIDSMESTQPDRRVLHVRTIHHDSQSVTVSVGDARSFEGNQRVPKLLRACARTTSRVASTELAIARDIVRAHRGELLVSSNPEGAAAFCITIPIARVSERCNVERPWDTNHI